MPHQAVEILSCYRDGTGAQLKSLDPQYQYCFSNDPRLWFRSVPRPTDTSKPKGLWFSSGTDPNNTSWLDWCYENNATHFLGLYLYKLELNYTDMLVCSKPEHLYRMSDQYSTVRFGTNGEFVFRIDWAQIYDQFSGIEITPYQQSCGLNPSTHWYYTWDCSGGCIWRSDAIASIELIGTHWSAGLGRRGPQGWCGYETVVTTVIDVPLTYLKHQHTDKQNEKK